ncbi:MAG: LysR family transcriptional regulator [Rhodobacteraceae bacterium]|nr:LysR family transcriptional regulator [Paracoccaceae bacterium]
MIKVETLRCFAIVAATGNLAEAAVRLGRTQSAVSMTLKRLEDHLGQRLFETERKNRLTPLGQDVFRLAQQQLRQYDQAIDAIEVAARAPHGVLRLASIPSASALIFPSALETLTANYPLVNVELRDMDSGMVIEAMMQGRADLGVVSGTPSLNGLSRTALFHDRYGVLCRSDHPLALTGQSPTIDQVFATRFVRNALCGLIQAPQVQEALPQTKVTVHNTHSLLAMVRSGPWTTILPETVARAAAQDLAFLPIMGLDDRRTASLLISTRTRMPDLVEHFSRILISDVRTRFPDLAAGQGAAACGS